MNKFLSATKISDFLACPAKHFLSHKTSSQAAEDGKDTHDMIYRALSGRPCTEDEQSVLRGIFNERFASKLVSLTNEKEMLLEHAFTMTVAGDWVLNGIIDCLIIGENMAVVRDWKTGLRVFTDEDMKRNVQGIIYSLYVFASRPEIESVIFELAMTSTYPQRVIRRVYTRDDVPEFEVWLGKIIADYQECQVNKVYPSKPGKQCQYCTHLLTCANERGVFDTSLEVVLTSEDELKTCMEKALLVEALKPRLNDAIETYLEAHPSIEETGDYIVSRKVKEGFEWSKKKAAAAWAQEKFPAALKLDTSAVRDAVLDDEDLRREALRLGFLNDKSGVKIEWDRKKPE